jgi:hypothetical protein
MSKSNVEKLMAKSVVCSFSKESISNKTTQAALQKLEEKIAAELEKQIIILPKKMTMKHFRIYLKTFVLVKKHKNGHLLLLLKKQ